MTYQLEKDLPITKKEEDILGCEKFAECLTAAIINYTNKEKNTDGLVILLLDWRENGEVEKHLFLI